jgi:hypothetical protein
MNVGVVVISHTSPDWARFVMCFKGINGESPTRELDKKNIPVGDPGTFAMALEGISGRPEAIGDLQRGYRSLDFVDFTFLVSFDDADYLQKFCNFLDISHVQYLGKHGTGFVLLKGTVKQLRNLIIAGSDFVEYRTIFNRMYDHLCTFGFKTAFGMKKVQSDGSFLLS